MYTVARLCVHLFPLGTIDSLICIHPTSRPAIGSERLDITLSSTGLASVRRRFFEFVISLACLLVSRIRPCLEMRSVSPFVRKLSAYYISSSSFIGLSLTRDQSSCFGGGPTGCIILSSNCTLVFSRGCPRPMLMYCSMGGCPMKELRESRCILDAHSCLVVSADPMPM